MKIDFENYPFIPGLVTSSKLPPTDYTLLLLILLLEMYHFRFPLHTFATQP